MCIRDRVKSSGTPQRCIAMQRWGVPEDLTGTIIYLASDAASFVTGQNIHVNGGTTVH